MIAAVYALREEYFSSENIVIFLLWEKTSTFFMKTPKR